ncbi:MAG: ester cyclase [Marinibacterium sp.]
MKGFDPKFADFPDYILGITREIWEDRGIATLNDYYAADIPVRSPGSMVIGNAGVIAATMATLAEFPDRQLLGEDVIWSGDPDTGMLSSHRIFSTATHLGDGMYGKATRKRLGYRIIAHCHARNNVIDDEWLIRDQTAIVRKMGWTPKKFARDLIRREGGPEACVKPFTPAIDVPGPYTGTGNDNPWGLRYGDVLTRIMGADMAVIAAEYDRAVQTEYPGGTTGHGTDTVDRMWMGLRAALPSGEFRISQAIGREDPMMPPRAALLWSLTGKHEGWGAFGRPAGANIHVMGACHAEFGALVAGHAKIRREFVLFDETAIWKQILLATGEV